MSELPPDLEAAIGRLRGKFGVKAQAKALASHLFPGERVYEVAPGKYRGGFGIAAVTDRRVVFAHKVPLGGASASEEMLLANVTSSTLDISSMGIARLKIHAPGNDLVLEKVNQVDADRFVRAVRTVTAAAATPSTPAPTPHAPPSVPAGWYPDPNVAGVQRYWDGSHWTEQTAPVGRG